MSLCRNICQTVSELTKKMSLYPHLKKVNSPSVHVYATDCALQANMNVLEIIDNHQSQFHIIKSIF